MLIELFLQISNFDPKHRFDLYELRELSVNLRTLMLKWKYSTDIICKYIIHNSDYIIIFIFILRIVKQVFLFVLWAHS